MEAEKLRGPSLAYGMLLCLVTLLATIQVIELAVVVIKSRHSPPPLAAAPSPGNPGRWTAPPGVKSGDWILVPAPMVCRGPGFGPDFELEINGKKPREVVRLNDMLLYARLP
jgi:hypothetical protein